MKTFKTVSPYALEGNMFDTIEKECMLITAKKGDKVNMMAANWGGVGVLWFKPVTFAFVRPERYTREFMDAGESFSMCFMGKNDRYKDEIMLCGTKSGREIDKVKETGFTVLEEAGVPYFEQSRMVVFCKKLLVQQFTPESVQDKKYIKEIYEEAGYHYMYISEVTKILIEE